MELVSFGMLRRSRRSRSLAIFGIMIWLAVAIPSLGCDDNEHFETCPRGCPAKGTTCSFDSVGVKSGVFGGCVPVCSTDADCTDQRGAEVCDHVLNPDDPK